MRVYVRRRTTISCITPTVKHGEDSVMEWGWAFANCRVRDLNPVKGKLNQTDYHNMLQHHTISSGTRLVDQGFVLMQDNDSKHTSKHCRRYIKSEEEQHVLQLMSWPAQSANLNPIELVWDQFERKLRAKQPTGTVLLWHLLQESWAGLSSVYLQSLMERMPRICEAVIAAKGFILMNQRF